MTAETDKSITQSLRENLAKRRNTADNLLTDFKERAAAHTPEQEHYFGGTGQHVSTFALANANPSRARINEVLASLRKNSNAEPVLELAVSGTSAPTGIPLTKDPSTHTL